MRKYIAAALAVILVLSLPLVASASSDTATIDLTLTLTESDVTPPPEVVTPTPDEPPEDDPEPSGPDFIINIPAALSLNEKSDVMFTWTNNNLVGNDSVVVSIDGAKTFPDGVFYLTTGDGSSEYKRIACKIHLYSTTHSPDSVEINGPADVEVAAFGIHPQNPAYPYPLSGGRLSFDPVYYLSPKYPGTYTGTIHFKIEVNH